jgi:PhnB protein
MKINPYLMFNGNCEAAFKFYEQCLGGKIVMMLTHGDAPSAEHVPAQWHHKIMHVCLNLGDRLLMGSDSPPGHFEAPKASTCSSRLTSQRRQNAFFTLWQKRER